MHKKIILTLLLIVSSQAYAYDMQLMLEKHLLPSYQELAEHTNELSIAANRYCSTEKGVDLEAMQRATKHAFLAWQAAQHIRFGPVLAFSRDRRFEFWPDKRGTVRKQLHDLINDPAIHADDFDIAQKSVAVQGFSALEQLLFSDSVKDKSHCLVIIKITNNLQAMANGVLAEWQTSSTPFVNLFLNPGEDNYIYRSESALAGELINTLYTQLEVMVTRKLDRPLGSSIEKARGKRAEGWRSQSALVAMSANLKACHEFYRYSFAPQLEANPLHEEIESAFMVSQATLEEIDMPLSQAVSNAEQRVLVERLKQELSQVKKLVASDLADTLGIALGFNSLDGD